VGPYLAEPSIDEEATFQHKDKEFRVQARTSGDEVCRVAEVIARELNSPEFAEARVTGPNSMVKKSLGG
jgi:hypothetical protein